MLFTSRYTVATRDGQNALLLNMRTLHFARISSRVYDEVIELIGNFGQDLTTKIVTEEVRHAAFELRQKGFLVSDPDLEVREVATRFDTIRQNAGPHLGLTIAPTLACNFSCPYCYERPASSTMHSAVQENILTHIHTTLGSGKFRSMHVTWYGGEPLLPESFPVVLSLSERIMDMCRQQSIPYTANIITNGYLLDRKKAGQLASINVSLAQITLDGPGNVHDKTRTLKNGEGTFDQIVRNIRECLDILRFSIRMNVSGNNTTAIVPLKEILRQKHILENRDRVSFYVSPVRAYTGSCRFGGCLTNAAFSLMQLELLQNGINRDGFNTVEEYPSAKESVCTAVNSDSYVIGPSGELYKCWLDLGRPALSVGNIGPDGLSLNDNIIKWTGFSPVSEHGSCLACPFLPVCMGGCPELNIRSRGQQENEACCNWKYIYKEQMLYLASCFKT